MQLVLDLFDQVLRYLFLILMEVEEISFVMLTTLKIFIRISNFSFLITLFTAVSIPWKLKLLKSLLKPLTLRFDFSGTLERRFAVDFVKNFSLF